MFRRDSRPLVHSLRRPDHLPPFLPAQAIAFVYNPESVTEPDSRSFMRKPSILVVCVVGLLLFSSCSPRDFLTRRLAADLIATSATFRAQRQLQLRTGVIANKDYLSPDYLVLQHRVC